MSDGKYVDGSFWFYAPNKGAAIFFCIAFCVSGCLHAWQASRYKCWILTPLFPFCSLLFTAGFALRVYGAFHYDNLDIFIASVCITYAAPPLLELQNYHILGRILYYVPYHSPIHPGRALTTFGFISGIIEALNGWGASYSANQSLTDKEIATGHALIKTSLIMQVVVAVLFITLAAVFHRRCIAGGVQNDRLKNSLVTLYTSIILILARTIYRIVEYFSVAELRYGPGFDPSTINPVVRYEWFFYVFEAAVMLINTVMFNMRHPRRYLPKNNKIYLSPDGVTEVEGPGFKDPRPFWQTLVDPFDVHGLITGRGRETDRFWDGEGTATRRDDDKTTNTGVLAV
ncbi:Rtm1p [Fusarium albosuccineum]|uniref:Rtm1p n=1 Tax=Fusarium albosuccineum TaxID=1237068 RepID=A0A8H4LJG2_9HYPO|nr:Rtm1p [Fusarium albosuccineum]